MAEIELVFPFELGEDRPWVLPHLGLGYLAAVLERRGVGCGVTDCTFISYTVPCPLPGSPLYDRMRGHIDRSMEWSRERENVMTYYSEYTGPALKDAMRLANKAYALAQSQGRKRAL